MYIKSRKNIICISVTQKNTILFLEDELEFLATLSNLLRDLGYRVLDASSAEQALTLLISNIPDLIIADIKLPGIDGFDFFEKVHAVKDLRSVPFIYLTAFNNLLAAQRAKEDGATDYITKPFELEYLLNRVQEILPIH
jgi:CheY-like chemotaxis protein